MNESGDIIVDPEHPEVKSAAEKATEEALKYSVTLPASDYIRVLLAEFERLRKERAKVDSTATQ